MATKLTNNLIRETSVLIEGKPLIVTLTSEQEITFKIKGTKKTKTLSIQDAFNFDKKPLFENSKEPEPEEKKVNRIAKKDIKEPLVNLYWLRSHSAIAVMDLKTKAKFDMILNSFLDEWEKENERC